MTTTTAKPSTVDAAAQASIGAAARELHLPTVRAKAAAGRDRRPGTATHLAYLAEVLAAEVEDRSERRRTRRINDAKFPRLKRLGHYMDAGEPVVLLGDSGTGKSHLLIALGLAACEQGRRVRYATTAHLVNGLVEAARRTCAVQIGRPLRPPRPALSRRTRLRQIDPRGAELLFQIITEREERAFIAIATNLPFSVWGTVFPTRGWSPPSSTGSPSTPTSSKPAPSPSDSAPARRPRAVVAGADLWRWHAGRVPAQHHLIRPARTSDNERVWPLARDFATSFTLERAAFDKIWEQLVVAPDTLLLIAENAQRDIVGYLLASSHLTFLANGPVAWVEEVMIKHSDRRSGLGRRLMEHAEEWAQSIGAAYLALASRRAGPFYLALDYEDSAVFYKKTLN